MINGGSKKPSLISLKIVLDTTLNYTNSILVKKTNLNRKFKIMFSTKFYGILLLLWGMMLPRDTAFAETNEISTRDANTVHLETELKQVHESLSTLQYSLKSDKSKLSALEKSLEQLQKDISSHSTQVLNITHETATLKEEIASLQQQQQKLKSQVSKQQHILAQNLEAIYMPRANSEIKLLLNQKNAHELRHSLNLYEYLQNSQREAIMESTNMLQNAASLEQEAIQKQLTFETKQQELLKTAELLFFEKQKREDLINELKSRISDKSLSRKNLSQRQKDLKNILNTLSEKLTAESENSSNQSSIVTQRGKLAWPTDIAKLPETPISLTKSRGLLIKVAPNTSVKTIYQGKVVFADWLKGYGLLIIVDHGDKFMSLYAYNNELLKHPGEEVLQGETIATVGNPTQDPGEVNLYFELRRHGEPVNPNQWLTERG